MSTTIDFGTGQTYTQLADAWEQVATFSPLADDYILRQVADVSASTSMALPTVIDTNGHSITITSDNWHQGDIDSGYKITSTANIVLYLRISNSGSVIVEKLNMIGGSGSSAGIWIGGATNTSNLSFQINDCIIRDFENYGINDVMYYNAPYIKLYNIKIFSTSAANKINGIRFGGLTSGWDANLYTDHRVMENITIRSPYTGVNGTVGIFFNECKKGGIGNEWTVKNCVVSSVSGGIRSNFAFKDVQDLDHDIDNCATTNNDLTYGTNVHNSINQFTEFKSATPTENNYCVPTSLDGTASHTRTPAAGVEGTSIAYTDTTTWDDGSLVLGEGGTTPTYATNDMDGTARVNFAIGAHEAPVGTYNWDFGDGSTPATTASPTHVYPNSGVYTTTQTVSANNGDTTATSTVTIYRTNEPIFRYGTSYIRMGGIKAPVFPVANGSKFHSYVTGKRRYTTTSRYHPTSNVRWQTQSIKSTDRDDIFDFWNTTLSKGYSNLTVIDNRGRMLFDASWNAYTENWKKQRGGIFDVDYDFQSPVSWTPPCFGAYLMTANDLKTHIMNDFDLTLDDSTLVDFAGDSNILRKNGYALKLADGAGTETGASGNMVWRKTKDNTSMSIFCQARTIGVADKLYLVDLNDGANRVSIILDDVDGSNDYIKGEITTGGTTGIVYKADTSSPSLPDDTWYDVCLTYEAENDKWFLYYVASEVGTSYTNFLDGQSTLENNILSSISNSVAVADTTWTTLNLLRESAAGTLNSKTAYLQNVMVFDDYIPSMQFNTLRRLCYLWNNKSTGTWPA